MEATQAFEEHLRTVLQELPPVDYAFAYGSGVFHQPGLYDSSARGSTAPMLDFMLAVEDPEKWHAENIARNAHHYSFLRRLGPRAVVCNADLLGSGVHFNMAVRMRDFVCKYGVVGLSTLHDDLLTWRRMYVSGRLQKPVATLIRCPSLDPSLHQNLQSAATASLLLLPPAFSLGEFFRAVCGLSYLGDIRMGLAEDSRKVHRLVQGSWHSLEAMYRPILQGTLAETAGLTATDREGWLQTKSKRSLTSLLSGLPRAVLERLREKCGVKADIALDGGRSEVAAAVLGSGRYRHLVRHSIASIVATSSRRQVLAGIFQAGGVRSAAYVWEKLRKAWRR